MSPSPRLHAKRRVNHYPVRSSSSTLGRLQAITTAPASGPAQSYAYTYNNMHQRTRATREDGSYWAYDYDDRSEFVSGKKFWSDNAPSSAGRPSTTSTTSATARRSAPAATPRAP